MDKRKILHESPVVKRRKCLQDFRLADVTFLLGENEDPVPAYKLLLSTANPVFEKMFSGEFKDKTEIKIPDFEAADFLHFLAYMYFDELNYKEWNLLKIYKIAQKYQVESLIDVCSDRIYKAVSYQNIFEIIELLKIYEDDMIPQKVQEFFSRNAIGILKVNPGFSGLSKDSLTKILQLQEIRCSEVLLFENLIAWADHQLQEKENIAENRWTILQGLLSLINLKIYDDLTYDPLYTTSRYNWDYPNADFLTLEKTNSTWFFYHTTSYETICYGFRMLLSNLSESLQKEEEFTFLIIKNKACEAVETFKIPVRDPLTIKDVYFTDPIILEPNKLIVCYIEFKSNANRFKLRSNIKLKYNHHYYKLMTSNYSDPQQTDLKLFLDKSSKDLHDIFGIFGE